MNKEFNKLTPEEEYVIARKGTERPFTGEYYQFKANGLFTCRRCDAPLYLSHHKFDSGCGWPSFDDAIPGAVAKKMDADGHRVEILCANCDGHLGHVFEGERFTLKNSRHCVNSLSMRFVPVEEMSIERAILASGCFWSKQFHLDRLNGVIATRVGYTGGSSPAAPTYREVSSGLTGHTESIEVYFDKNIISYEALLNHFYQHHNPSISSKQGENNNGKYRSAIFYTNEMQKEVAENVINKLTEEKEVFTQLAPAYAFYGAEGHHQKYYDKLGKTPEES